MLFKWSWLRLIKAIKDYHNNIYHIKNENEKQHKLKIIKFLNYKSFSHIKLNDEV